MHSTILTVSMTALLVAGCAARVGYSASVSSDGYGPDLVYVGPGVQVIADFDEPIFYADSFYWRFSAGTWYRSPHYTGGWVYATPPAAVQRIDRPHAYVHYRPAGWTSRRDRVAPQQRAYQPPPQQRAYQPPPQQRGYQPPPQQRSYQPPPPRAQPQPPRAQPQQPPPRAQPPAPRAQPQQPRGGPPGRDHDRSDDRDHGDRGDHHDRR